MSDHVVHVYPSGDRARAQCICGQLDSPERRGDRAHHLAELDGRAHLEAVEASRQWVKTDLGFAIESSVDTTTCPVCDYEGVKSSLELQLNSFDEVTCSHGHVFDAAGDEDYFFVKLQTTHQSSQVVSSEEPVAIIDMNTESPDCPYCGMALLFNTVDVLHVGTGPFVISCVSGHEFDTYVRDFMTVYMFPHVLGPIG